MRRELAPNVKMKILSVSDIMSTEVPMAVSDTREMPQCPKCQQPMRREIDGARQPPMPQVFWFCMNQDCEEGGKNRVYSGG